MGAYVDAKRERKNSNVSQRDQCVELISGWGQYCARFHNLFLDSFKEAPGEIVLDLDATDDPLHGHQEGRFFHGYYDCYCYLPLYIFCGDQLLAAKLRPSDIDGAPGAVEEAARIVVQIRKRWPATRIVLRADSGFAREAL